LLERAQRGIVTGVQPQIEHAGKTQKALKWEELYQSWRNSTHEYPELGDLSTFTEIQWSTGTYWMPARPTEASSLTGSGLAWVDWWPRSEVASRAEALVKGTSYGSWKSTFSLLPEACRYTLRYVWAARRDPELTAAAWLAATMIMLESSREERSDWGVSARDMCRRTRYLCLERMEKSQLGTWLHSCKYPLPEAINRFIRPPTFANELVEMAAANAAFIHNRWALVWLCDEKAREMTQPLIC